MFENEFVPNEEDIREYVAQQHLPERTGFVTLGSLLAVAAIIALWILINSITTLLNTTLFHLFFGICLIVVVSVVSRVLKLVQLNTLVNKYMRQNKSDVEGFRTIFYEDGFEVSDKSYRYVDVSNVLYGRTCLYIITDGKRGIMIKDDAEAFKTGEHAQFWEFLDSKVKIQKEKKKQSPLSLFR